MGPRIDRRAEGTRLNEEFDLQIDWVVTPAGGRIGMCACPGGRRIRVSGADIADDLERDLHAISASGAAGLVSLIEQAEFEILRVTTLPVSSRKLGIWWRHLPIRDMRAPDETFEQRWQLEGTRLRGLLEQGTSVVFHCWAGLGRTGTVTARLLVELGTPPGTAIHRIREARLGAIQSPEQEEHILACRAIPA